MGELALLIASFLGTAGLVALCGRLSLGPWRQSGGQPWAERARLLWPARMSVNLAALGGLCLMVAVEGIGSGQFQVPGLGAFVTVVLGSLAGAYPFSRAISPWIRFGPWFRQQMGRTLFMFAWLAVYFWLVHAMPDHPGPSDWGRVALGLGIVVGLAGGWWLRWLVRATPTPAEQARLDAVVAKAVRLSGRAPRRAWLSDMPMANAFAIPATGELVFTRRLFEVLDDEEIGAVCLHEMAHLGEPGGAIAGRLLGGLAPFPLVLIRPLHAAFGSAGMFALFGAVFLLIRLRSKLWRALERRADAAGAVESPEIYARALEKIYRDNQIPAVLPGKGRTHPHLYDRMVAAGVTPDFPRPLPPQRLMWTGWLAILLPGVALVLLLWWKR